MPKWVLSSRKCTFCATAGGYFVIVTIEDQEIAAQGPLAQIRAEAEVLKVVTSPERTRELLGQIQLEIQ